MELIKYYTQYYIANAGCALLYLENVYTVLVPIQVITKSLFFLWIYLVYLVEINYIYLKSFSAYQMYKHD